MKTLKFIGMALLAIIMSVNLVACSSDDNNDSEEQQTSINLLGTWKCTSTIPYEEHSATQGGNELYEGSKIKFIQNNKCFIDYWGDGFDTGSGNINNPTESDWDSEEGCKWLLNGNNLTVMESDLDRWVGTVTVKGNEMIFTYKYQDWNYDKQTMISESKETYTSKFTLTSRN